MMLTVPLKLLLGVKLPVAALIVPAFVGLIDQTPPAVPPAWV
jgi:hypothetical protein